MATEGEYLKLTLNEVNVQTITVPTRKGMKYAIVKAIADDAALLHRTSQHS